jgi:Protein of unknown function (DUF2586)
MQQPIQFQYTRGNGRYAMPNDDHISCMVFVGQALPAGYTPNANGFSDLHQYRNMTQVESAGITQSDPLTAVIWYHCVRFFDFAPGATLYVMVTQSPGNTDYVRYCQTQVNGVLRRVGVHDNRTAYADMTTSGILQNLSDQTLNLAAENRPCFVVYACDMYGYTGAAVDLRPLNLPYLTVSAAQDGAATGAEMYASLNQSIGCIGAAIGCMAARKVNESIGWVEKFNLSRGAGLEFDVPAIANGVLVHDDETQWADYEQTRHLMMCKYTGINGTYFRSDPNCTYHHLTDLFSISRGETIQKVQRLVNAALLPAVNSPMTKDPSTGFIAPTSVAYLEELAASQLKINMTDRGELSGVKVSINPELGFDASTQKHIVYVLVECVDVANAEQFNVSLSYVTNI